MAGSRWQLGATKTGVRQSFEHVVQTDPHPWRMNVRRLNRWEFLLGPILWLALILSALSLLWFATWPERVIESNTVILSSISPLPRVNPYATRDAEALSEMQELLNVSPFVTERLDYSQFQQAVSGIAGLSQPNRWFLRRPTVNLVYVNCPGLALPSQGELVPYLIPTDAYGAAAPVSERVVPVEKVIENLVASNSSYKVLVLDCQQLDSFWPAGVVSNQFVAAVSQLVNDKKEQYPNLFVLLSCSDSELSWNDDSVGHSVFNRYFLEGLTGAADKSGTSNRKVSLEELYDYVREKVNLWAQENRGVTQQPLMLYTGHRDTERIARLVPLTIVPDARPVWKSKLRTEDATLKKSLSQLQASWENYYQTARSLPSPTSCAPQLFRLWEDSLLNAEAGFRQQDVQTMLQAIRTANDYARQVRATQKRYSFGDAAFSLPLIRMFANPDQSKIEKSPVGNQETKGSSDRLASSKKGNAASSNADSNSGASNKPADTQTASENPPAANPASGSGGSKQGASVANESQAEEAKQGVTSKSSSDATTKSDQPASVSAKSGLTKPMTLAEVRSAMTEIEASTGAVAKYGKQFQEREHDILPAEAELVRMMVDRWPTDKGQEPLRDFGHRVINSRIQVELAAVPGGHFAYRVFPWVKAPMKAVDQRQREVEDLFFAIAGPPPRADLESRNHLNAKLPSVDEITSTGKKLATAHALRDQSVSILPGLSKFYRRSFVSYNGLRNQIIEGTFELVNETHQLCVVLRSKDDLEAPNRTNTLKDLIAQSDEVASIYFEILDLVNREYQQLAESSESDLYLSSNQWKRLDAILRIPFDYSQRRRSESPGNGDVSPFAFIESPNALASRRVRLLERISFFAPERQTRSTHLSPGQGTEILQTDTPRPDEVATAEFATALFSLPNPNPTVISSVTLQNGFSSTLARAWQDAYRMATTNLSPTRSQLVIGDLATRIIDPHVLEPNWVLLERTPSQMLRAQQLSDFAQWYGQRRAGDLWSALTGDGTPYYLKTSGELDRLAEQLVASQQNSNQGLSSFAEESDSSQRKDEPYSIGLQPDQLAVEFRGTEQERIRFNVQLPVESRPDHIDLRLTSDSDQLEITQDSTDRGELEYQINRKSTTGFKTDVTATLFFRGGSIHRRIPVESISDWQGATVDYQYQLSNEAKLRVSLGEISRAPEHLLFVLDSSRSMAELQRLQELKQVLQAFSDSVSQNGLSVGVRVFGSRVVWKENDVYSEAEARQDTQLVLPIRAFPGTAFSETISRLKPVGESPLFYSLLEAKNDFQYVDPGSRRIIVISDGSDNWADQGLKPGIVELRRAYQDSGIPIYTIGFKSDPHGWEQLQNIAAATGGKAVKIDNAKDLLTCVLDLAQLRRYDVQPSPTGVSDLPRELNFTAPDLLVVPGSYDVRILDPKDNAVAESSVSIRPGQRHDLIFRGGQLTYDPFNERASRAVFTDETTGVSLVVSDFKFGDGNLKVTLAMSHRHDPNWWPENVQFKIQPHNHNEIYSVASVPPNVAGHHVPAWTFTLNEWPTDASFAKVSAAWHNPDRRPMTYQLSLANRSLKTLTQLPDGIRVTRNRQNSPGNGGGSQALQHITLVSNSKQSILDWSIHADAGFQYSRQNYNVAQGIYNVEFLPTNDALKSITLVQKSAEHSRIQGDIDLRTPTLD
ncbi:MAG: hypothetical protein CMJ77_06370 [Planctomycetaceae bacterium]|nr:hypothetical protein [Planctomycetaceae bacterium]